MRGYLKEEDVEFESFDLMVRRTYNLQTWRDFIEGLLGSNQPNMSYLRVSESMCFRHVPEQVRKKLDD